MDDLMKDCKATCRIHQKQHKIFPDTPFYEKVNSSLNPITNYLHKTLRNIESKCIEDTEGAYVNEWQSKSIEEKFIQLLSFFPIWTNIIQEFDPSTISTELRMDLQISYLVDEYDQKLVHDVFEDSISMSPEDFLEAHSKILKDTSQELIESLSVKKKNTPARSTNKKIGWNYAFLFISRRQLEE